MSLHGARAECPECHRKGVGFAGHPHAYGYKDYTRARCRYCRCTFKIISLANLKRTIGPLIFKPKD